MNFEKRYYVMPDGDTRWTRLYIRYIAYINKLKPGHTESVRYPNGWVFYITVTDSGTHMVTAAFESGGIEETSDVLYFSSREQIVAFIINGAQGKLSRD